MFSFQLKTLWSYKNQIMKEITCFVLDTSFINKFMEIRYCEYLQKTFLHFCCKINIFSLVFPKLLKGPHIKTFIYKIELYL